MNVIFLTLVRISDIEDRGIYQDLMRKFRDEGFEVYIVMPHERSLGKPTELREENGVCGGGDITQLSQVERSHGKS